MKIGILTHYYGSNNYGGVLQAYALVKVLRDMGYDAEQICYNFYQYDCLKEESTIQKKITTKEKKSIVFVRGVSFAVYLLRKLLRKVLFQVYRGKYEKIEKRRDQIRAFLQTIDHSVMVYTKETIRFANDMYDVFIVGSDQVWNFSFFNRAFFLEFVKEKKRIAYAASAGKSSFTKAEREYLSSVLPNFSSISVREKNLCGTLAELTNGIPVECVLDPVLLLDKEEWDKFAEKSDVAENNYLFCYFLGKDERIRILAKKVAKILKLQIVSIPYLGGKITHYDNLLGGVQKIDASPYDFVSLVKNAAFVMTDSFHGTAFSLLYNKRFATFTNNSSPRMNTRIESITSLFNCKERFCDSIERMTTEYIINELSSPNYGFDFEKYWGYRKRSCDFLLKSLKD